MTEAEMKQEDEAYFSRTGKRAKSSSTDTGTYRSLSTRSPSKARSKTNKIPDMEADYIALRNKEYTRYTDRDWSHSEYRDFLWPHQPPEIDETLYEKRWEMYLSDMMKISHEYRFEKHPFCIFGEMSWTPATKARFL